MAKYLFKPPQLGRDPDSSGRLHVLQRPELPGQRRGRDLHAPQGLDVPPHADILAQLPHHGGFSAVRIRPGQFGPRQDGAVHHSIPIHDLANQRNEVELRAHLNYVC